MPYTITALTLGQLLGSDDMTIKRNAISIVKRLQAIEISKELGAAEKLPRCPLCGVRTTRADLHSCKPE